MAIVFVFGTFILAATIVEVYGEDIFMKRQIDKFMDEANEFVKTYLHNPIIIEILYNNIQIGENDYKEFLFKMKGKAIEVSEEYKKINPKYFDRIEVDILDDVINIEKDVESIIQVIELEIRKHGW